MRNKKDEKIAIYTDKGDGLFEELTIDIYNRDYEYVHNCKKQDLGKIYDKKVKEFCVDKDFFYTLFDILERNYSGTDTDAHDYIDEKQYEIEESKKPVISKEKIWQAIRWEMKETEIDRIISYDYRYEKDYYYDFDLIIEKIHTFMKGAKTVHYFTSWCILLMRCFMDNMKRARKELSEIFYDLGDFFDGRAFMDSSLRGEEKLKECREIIAWIKYYNHRICDIQNKEETDFTTNKVITYVSFGFCLGSGDTMYRLCIVDKKKKTVNYLYVHDIDYSEEINYTFLSQAEFEDLTHIYYEDYALDTSIGADYAIVRGW